MSNVGRLGGCHRLGAKMESVAGGAMQNCKAFYAANDTTAHIVILTVFADVQMATAIRAFAIAVKRHRYSDGRTTMIANIITHRSTASF